MITSTVWFVADVLKLAIGAMAGTVVEVAAYGCLLELLEAGWRGGRVAGREQGVRGGCGGRGLEGMKGLSRL